MEKIKFLFQQTMMISFGILVGISFQGLIYGNEIYFTWYHPLSILISGVVCSLPTLILWSDKEVSRKKYIIQIIVHFLLLFAIVMTMGKIFRWYTVIEGALFVAGEFIFVYVFVWVATTWIGAVDGKNINNALDGIRDEE